eukprot:CAMPEP_0170604320 /NCGR_PEP_ID=MMETSP0224-20130122/19359_1 /TAXON_ID=285029 /ORGANISM="Togula jolla, Strain CCCM 725" /LENGTH=361 /DNA_ID=CAMNT_0010929213 /DNA_START=42 /DNA_END=1124 /DNA_ORIENTATION=+
MGASTTVVASLRVLSFLFPILAQAAVLKLEEGSAVTQMTRKKLCEPVAHCILKLDQGKECELLPVPERSRLPLLPTGSNFTLTRLRSNIWSFSDGVYISLIIVQRRAERLTLIDVPESSGLLLKTALEELLKGTKPKRIDIIYSHGHYDHIGGGMDFYQYAKEKYPGAETVIWGTAETRRFIEVSKSKRAPLPDVIIGKEGAVLELRPRLHLHMTIVGGHMSEDLLVFIPRDGEQKAIAMLVDIIFPHWSPWPNLALTADTRSYLQAHHNLLKYDFDIFVGGHLRLGSKDDVRDNLRWLEDLLETGAASLAESTSEEFAAAGFGRLFDPSALESGNIWWAFVDVVQKTRVDKCYRTMLEKW